jgi:aspartyl-tRNA(Asn)/glutamyl-tRNA(Gln) amidotransferase subunit A
MFNSIQENKSALESGKTLLDILEHYLTRINAHKDLNAYLEVFEESARIEAVRIQEKINNGTAGKLAGSFIGIKDNLCLINHKVSASSKILEGFQSLYTATAVQRLIDEDAIILGRLNCDEFAMGSSNEKSAYGPVRNSLNPAYVPGGSSGGSAVAVADGLCTASLGSDTGGSVRQPASWTGTYGLKPTYGRISRYGLIAYASSFDQIGTFTTNLSDAELLYQIMAGKDPKDATTSSREIEESREGSSVLRFGVLKEYMNHPGLDSEVKASLDSIITTLREAGHEVTEFSFPYMDYVVPVYYVLTTAEASSNLSRFDGVHFGHRSSLAEGVEATYIQSRNEGFGEEVKRRIMTGTFVLSNEQYDAYYTKGQKVRRVLQDKTREIFTHVDCILTPTTPSTAFKIGEVKDPIEMYLQDIFTVHANLTGNPAISIPVGTHSNGLPFGVQLMTDQFRENDLFYATQLVENITA